MKRTIGSVLFVGLICTGAPAFAQQDTSQAETQSQTSADTSATTHMSPQHQWMKDCIAKEQAGNSSMSTSDAKKACKEQAKTQKSNSEAPSQTDSTQPAPPK
jgi:hypothetical protein